MEATLDQSIMEMRDQLIDFLRARLPELSKTLFPSNSLQPLVIFVPQETISHGKRRLILPPISGMR